MISTIASSYEASADLRLSEPCAAWRQAWQQLREDYERGQQVSIGELADYLPDVPLADQYDCACDLIAEHMRLYAQAGEPQLEDYVAALSLHFPWLLNLSSLPADLIDDEFVIRSTPPDGDYPRLANYLSRFPNRPDAHEQLARRCLANQRYIKLRLLGIGSLGVVHEAYDSIEDRLVAVKEVSISDVESAQRLKTEMRLASDLDHPGIVETHYFGRTQQVVFYVMDLVAGQSLSDRISEYHVGRSARSGTENRRQLGRLIEYVAQMCDAVSHAHQRGILHRDLKPGNVIIRDNGQAVIIDWGLARRLRPVAGPGSDPADENASGTIVGTPQYMAPEQLDRQETPASDIFSLGATLYEVLAGRPPYNWRGHALPSDWQTTIRQARIVPPQCCSSIPPQLNTICMKALSSSPQERYAKLDDLATDLQQFLETYSVPRTWLTWFIGRRP